MRDIVVTVLILGSVPFIIRRPWVGILMWCWLSYMSPHRMTWGFSYHFNFAEIIAVVTIASIWLSREPARVPITGLTSVWFVFIAWMCLSTYLALIPETANEQLIKVLKIQLTTFLTIMVMNTRERLTLLLAVITASIAFFGIKGGIFTLLRGGDARVWGPPGTIIQDNNALAVALFMVLPLMYYLREQLQNAWFRRAMLAAMVLVLLAALGTYSRGAVIAGAAMLGFFLLKSRRKLAYAAGIIIIIPLLIAFMPEKWNERINSMLVGAKPTMDEWSDITKLSMPIATRDNLHFWPTDRSAVGRLNAWNYAINVANARITGGGLESWHDDTFAIYAPIPELMHSSHSIYFSAIADHGWVGLGLFLLIAFMAWRTATKTIAQCEKIPELKWLALMCKMVQVSMVAYAAGGAFLSLAYFDLYWHFIAIIVIARRILDNHLETQGRLLQTQRNRFGRTVLMPQPATRA